MLTFILFPRFETNIDCINPAFAINRGKYVYVCCESIKDGYILTIDSETNKSVHFCFGNYGGQTIQSGPAA